MAEYTPTEADIRDTYGVGWNASPRPDAPTPHDVFSSWLAAHDAEVRADERAKRPDREITERADADALPLGSVILDAYAAVCVRVGESPIFGWRRCTPAVKGGEHRHYPFLPGQLLDLEVLSSLALEPEAREEPTTEDLLDTRAGLSLANAAWGEGAAHWKRAQEVQDAGEGWHKPVSPYSAPLLARIKAEGPRTAPEAREEAELFHDQDGDLWKLTDKGEWFHEEEPGEFRQVLSIDAEDQTLTPVGHAELAPTAEAREEPSAVAKADADTLARVMAKVYEPDLDWDNPTDFDLLDRETLTDSARRILERMKWSGLTFWHLDDLVLDEFDPAPRPAPEAREIPDAEVAAAYSAFVQASFGFPGAPAMRAALEASREVADA